MRDALSKQGNGRRNRLSARLMRSKIKKVLLNLASTGNCLPLQCRGTESLPVATCGSAPLANTLGRPPPTHTEATTRLARTQVTKLPIHLRQCSEFVDTAR